jgi:hypothetical protein
VLDFVNPVRSFGRLIDRGSKLKGDKAERNAGHIPNLARHAEIASQERLSVRKDKVVAPPRSWWLRRGIGRQVMRTRMPTEAGIIATKVAMACATENWTCIPT